MVTMWLFVSDFWGSISFKYPTLLPHQLLVWEIRSAYLGENWLCVLYAEEGEETGCWAGPGISGARGGSSG